MARTPMLNKAIERIQSQLGIVGRAAEIRLGVACLLAQRNLMLEGPVGVGKSVLAEALASYLGRDLFRVDGDERYTEQKMTGWFDPALVLKDGYKKDYFIEGPLVRAMRTGGILFINEINRMP
ncbi:MAG: MoxR family ATPase, partial [Verrucomicrobiota bacterium]